MSDYETNLEVPAEILLSSIDISCKVVPLVSGMFLSRYPLIYEFISKVDIYFIDSIKEEARIFQSFALTNSGVGEFLVKVLPRLLSLLPFI